MHEPDAPHPLETQTPRYDPAAEAAAARAWLSSAARPELSIVEAEELVVRLAERLPDLSFEALLGRGGMGAVFRARQKRLDRDVAVKVLLPPQQGVDADAWRERFEREAKALARLSHPNVVAVHDFGTDEELAWIVLEYVDGASLRQLLDEGRLTQREAAELVPQLCEALAYAHSCGIVHRDLKPENVLVDPRGHAKLVDFGIAKLVDAVGNTLTGSAQAMGTFRYMAPEQIDRPREVDHRADIYSLGVLIYELLTGEVPQGRFDLPSERVGVDTYWDGVVMRSLEREPARRFQSAHDLRVALERARAGAPPPPPPSDPAAAEGGRGTAVFRAVRQKVDQAEESWRKLSESAETKSFRGFLGGVKVVIGKGDESEEQATKRAIDEATRDAKPFVWPVFETVVFGLMLLAHAIAGTDLDDLDHESERPYAIASLALLAPFVLRLTIQKLTPAQLGLIRLGCASLVPLALYFGGAVAGTWEGWPITPYQDGLLARALMLPTAVLAGGGFVALLCATDALRGTLEYPRAGLVYLRLMTMVAALLGMMSGAAPDWASSASQNQWSDGMLDFPNGVATFLAFGLALLSTAALAARGGARVHALATVIAGLTATAATLGGPLTGQPGYDLDSGAVASLCFGAILLALGGLLWLGDPEARPAAERDGGDAAA